MITRDKTPKNFMLQLRVIRAFKSTLEDLEDKRSIHSWRSVRNAQPPALANFFYQNKAPMFKGNRTSSPDSSPSGNISISIPTSRPAGPLNINDFNARYMDDDGPPSMDERTNGNGQSKETRI
jgi:hypothetical protein